jgi:integrase
VTTCALKLAPLVFVRPGELRQAQWPEIDLDKCEWRIPAEPPRVLWRRRSVSQTEMADSSS